MTNTVVPFFGVGTIFGLYEVCLIELMTDDVCELLSIWNGVVWRNNNFVGNMLLLLFFNLLGNRNMSVGSVIR